MARTRTFIRLAVSPTLCMALDRLTVFSGAYQTHNPGTIEPVVAYLVATLPLLMVALLAFRVTRFQRMSSKTLAHIALALFLASVALGLAPQSEGASLTRELSTSLARIALLFFFVAAIRPLAKISMTDSIKILAFAACASCASVPFGYLSLFPNAAPWVATLTVALAGGCWGSVVLSPRHSSEPDGEDIAPLSPRSLSGLLYPLTCYIGMNLFLGLLRRSLLDETGTSLWSDAIPPLGIVIGSVALLLYWHHEPILFKSKQKFPLISIALALLFAALPLMTFKEHALVLLIVCSLYEALYLVLVAACIELKRHRSIPILFSWSFSLLVYRMARPLGDELFALVGASVANTFTGLCCMSIVLLLLLFLFNTLRLSLASKSDESDTGSSLKIPDSGPNETKAQAESPLRTCPKLVEGARISPREMDVLELVMKARTASRIADELFVSENTVKAHMKSIYAKLDVHSRQELLDVIDEALRQ